MAEYLKKFGKRLFAILFFIVLAFALMAQLVNVLIIGSLRRNTNELFGEVQENVDGIAANTLYTNYDNFMQNLLDVETNSIKYVLDNMRLDVNYVADLASHAYVDSEQEYEIPYEYAHDFESSKNTKIYYDKGVDPNSESVIEEEKIISNLKNVLYYTVADSLQQTSGYILTDTGIFFYADNNGASFDGKRIHGFRERDWYEAAKATSSTIIVESGQDAITSKNVISIIQSIRAGNDFKGVVGIDIFLDDLDFANTALSAPEEFNLFLVDSAGSIIYNARADRFSEEAARQGTLYEFISEAIEKGSGEGRYYYRGNYYRTLYKKVENSSFILFISIREGIIKGYIATLSNLINNSNYAIQRSFDSTITNMVLAQILCVSLITAFIFVVAQVVSKRMSMPLSKLSEILNAASKIQQDMLPQEFETISNRKDIEISATNIPEAEVGGDFYDYIIKGNKLFLIIADVSGSGIPAALFMAKTSELLAAAIELTDSPKVILSYVNSELCQNNNEYYFVTIALYCVDLVTREVVFANSGHEDSIIIKRNGEVIKLDEKRSAPMGLDEYNNYEEERFVLDVEDILFLYTDGVVEAMNTNEELYGIKRLKETLSTLSDRSVKNVIDVVKESVDNFSTGTEQYDDITMLCFKFKELSNDESLIYNFEKEFDANYESIDDVNEFVETSLSDAYEGKDSVYKKYLNKLYICCEEIVVNIIDHAYKGTNDGKKFTVKILIDRNADKLSITTIDSGIGFDPTKVVEPNVLKGLEERKTGGLGVHITKRTMDVMEYEFKDGKNVLTITKYL